MFADDGYIDRIEFQFASFSEEQKDHASKHCLCSNVEHPVREKDCKDKHVFSLSFKIPLSTILLFFYLEGGTETLNMFSRSLTKNRLQMLMANLLDSQFTMKAVSRRIV